MIDHLIRGFMFLIIIVFGLPVIFSLAMGLISTGKANFKSALHIILSSLRVVANAVEDLADELAKVIVKRYPKQKKTLQPTIKAALLAVFIVIFLCLLSAFN